MYASLNKTYSSAPITQKRKVDSQKDKTAPVGQIFSKRCMAASSHTLPLSNILQKQAITKKRALQRLQKRVPAFQAGSEIIQVWDTDWPESNCHGYTLYQSPGNSLNADDFLQILSEYSPSSRLPISLFFQGDKLCHSGRYSDGKLTHLLIEIGILQTVSNGTETYGYTQRFNLPEDIEEFYDFIAPSQLRKHLWERTAQVTCTFSSKYYQWLEHFNGNEAEMKATFDHVYDIKDELNDETKPLIYLEEDPLYFQMEEFARTLS